MVFIRVNSNVEECAVFLFSPARGKAANPFRRIKACASARERHLSPVNSGSGGRAGDPARACRSIQNKASPTGRSEQKRQRFNQGGFPRKQHGHGDSLAVAQYTSQGQPNGRAALDGVWRLNQRRPYREPAGGALGFSFLGFLTSFL